ncbi:MAG: Calx-beta domain-containing protein [Planctomycetaceae bacterium]
MLERFWLDGLFSTSRAGSSKRRARRPASSGRVGRPSKPAEVLETRALLTNAAVILNLVELPGDVSPGHIDAGEEFDVEVHFRDTINDQAVFSGYVDVNFDPAHLEAQFVTHDSDYASAPSGTIDNATGIVDELGGSDGFAPPAQSLVATIRFLALTDSFSTITTDITEQTFAQITSHAVNNSGDLRNVTDYGSLDVNQPVVGPGNLIGIDLGGGATPTNWTSINSSSDTTRNNLIDETGAATGVNAFFDVDSSPGGTDSFNFPAGQMPIHSQSLAGLDGNYFDASGNVQVTFSSLTPATNYEVYVFAGDTVSATQSVEITGDAVVAFSQTHGINQLVVNDEVGDSARDLSSYAKIVAPDAGGNINIRVFAGPPSGFGLAGVAIREASGAAPAPNVIIDDVTVDEGDGIATFAVRLSSPAEDYVILSLTTTAGTATASDFTPTTVQVSFAPGATTATGTLKVPITDDTRDEPDEQFTVGVLSVDAGRVGDTSDTGIGTIVDNDLPPTVTLAINNGTLSETGGSATITATLSARSSFPVTVNLGFTGTATGPGTDFTVTNSQIVIPANVLSGSVTLQAVHDAIDELDETVIVDITGVTNGTVRDSANCNNLILDDDIADLSVNDVTANEADGTLTFTISAPIRPLLIFRRFSTAQWYGHSEPDYTAVSGAATVAAGTDPSFAFVPISSNDGLPSRPNGFPQICPASNAVIGDAQGIGTITDNTNITLSVDDVTVDEGAGTLTFTITADQAPAATVTVDYATAVGTATAADFTATSGRQRLQLARIATAVGVDHG